MTNLIAAAVAPLKPIQMDRAEATVRARHARVVADIAKGDGTMAGTIAALKAEYEAKGWKYWENQAKEDGERIREFFKSDWQTKQLVLQSADVVERRVDDARFVAAQSFESYVAKMIGKIGDVTEATMVYGTSVWGFSMLKVTTVAGEQQVWTTQQIVNCSSLGKLFNQWPSRKATSKASIRRAEKLVA